MTLTQYEQDRIRTIVHYENETRKVLNIEAPRIAAIMQDYVGKKIYKADGTLLKAIQDKVGFLHHAIRPLGDGTASLRIWFHTDAGSAYIKTSICYSVSDSGCNYYDGYAYICDMDYGKGTLKAIYAQATTERAMLDIAFELQQFDDVKGIKQYLSAEEDKLFYGIKRL